MRAPIVFDVKPRPARHGFNLICERLLPYDMWYVRLYDAVLYAMQSGRDHRCEIRIYDRAGGCLERLQIYPRRCPAQSLAALLPD